MMYEHKKNCMCMDCKSDRTVKYIFIGIVTFALGVMVATSIAEHRLARRRAAELLEMERGLQP